MRPDALQGHDLAYLLAQARITLRGAVLQGHRAAVGDELAGHLTHGVQRQGRDERHATGQGHDLGPCRHREERADLRGDHPPGPRRVVVHIPVNA